VEQEISAVKLTVVEVERAEVSNVVEVSASLQKARSAAPRTL